MHQRLNTSLFHPYTDNYHSDSFDHQYKHLHIPSSSNWYRSLHTDYHTNWGYYPGIDSCHSDRFDRLYTSYRRSRNYYYPS